VISRWLMRLLAVLAPASRRAEWRREWQAELAHRQDDLAAIVREQKLDKDTAYLAVGGAQVFVHVLEFAFKSLRRADLDKAVGAELEGVVPGDLEELVYASEPRSWALRPRSRAGCLSSRCSPSPTRTPRGPRRRVVDSVSSSTRRPRS